jgi:hypothetical protein
VESLLRFEDEHTYLLFYRTPKWLGRFAPFPKAKETLVRAPHKFFWDQVSVPYRSWKERADVIFHPKFSVPFVAHCPVVMGLQELAWWVWPEHYEHSNVMYQKLMLPLSCRRAAHLFPMAYWILEENRRHLRLPLRDATVTWPAPHEYLQPIEDRAALQEFKERWHLLNRFLLGVTRVDYSGIGGSTNFFPGRTHRPHCAHSFRSATASRTTSVGFPTVISKTGACPEVVEDAALLADPFDADDVAGKILRLVTDGALREDLRTKGLRRMSELTWDRTARITLDALVQVVEGTRGKVEHRMNI